MEALRTLSPVAHAELHARAAHLQEDKDKIAKAVRLMEEGRIDRVLEKEGDFEVVGLTSGTIYLTNAKGCSCKAKRTPETIYHCYHMLGIALYRWVAETMQKQGTLMFVEEPLDTIPPETSQDAPQSTNVSDATPEPSSKEHVPTTPEEPKNGLALLPPILPLQRRPISAIIADLSRPLPKACVATLAPTAKRNVPIEYLHWHTVSEVLDTYAPGWRGEVARAEKVGEKWAVTYRITIPAAEGDCWREDIGMEDEDKDDYGDAMTNALASAFKRAAAKFGVGRNLYQKDDTHAALEKHFATERQAVGEQLTKRMAELGLERGEVLAWLSSATGAQANGHIPTWAIRALLGYLSVQTKVHP